MRRKEYGPAALRIRLPHITVRYREVNLKGGQVRTEKLSPERKEIVKKRQEESS